MKPHTLFALIAVVGIPAVAEAQNPLVNPSDTARNRATLAWYAQPGCDAYASKFFAWPNPNNANSPDVRTFTFRPRSPGQSPVTSFEQALFTADFVMLHQAELGLTADQRKVITDELKALQNATVDLQWGVQAQQQKLIEVLEQRPIKEQDATAQINKLLELESGVKLKHFTSLVRIKNSLSDAQVQKLARMQGGCEAAGVVRYKK